MDWRARDQEVYEILSTHPSYIRLLVERGLFPSYEVARRRLNKLRKRKRIKLVGTVQLDEGRPLDVYFKGNIRSDMLYHETRLTEFLFRIGGRCARGHDVDPDLRPDATLWLDGKTLQIELDTGEVPYKRVLERYKIYARYDFDVLWIAPTETRMEGLRNRAGIIKNKAMFTTFHKCLSEWFDSQGVGIPVVHGGGNGAGSV